MARTIRDFICLEFVYVNARSRRHTYQQSTQTLQERRNLSEPSESGADRVTFQIQGLKARADCDQRNVKDTT